MGSDDNSKSQIVHSYDFTQPTILSIIQSKAAVLFRHLDSEATELPEMFGSVIVDTLKRWELFDFVPLK